MSKTETRWQLRVWFRPCWRHLAGWGLFLAALSPACSSEQRRPVQVAPPELAGARVCVRVGPGPIYPPEGVSYAAADATARSHWEAASGADANWLAAPGSFSEALRTAGLVEVGCDERPDLLVVVRPCLHYADGFGPEPMDTWGEQQAEQVQRILSVSGCQPANYVCQARSPKEYPDGQSIPDGQVVPLEDAARDWDAAAAVCLGAVIDWEMKVGTLIGVLAKRRATIPEPPAPAPASASRPSPPSAGASAAAPAPASPTMSTPAEATLRPPAPLPASVAVLPVTAKAGVSKDLVEVLEDLVLGNVQKGAGGGLKVVGRSDIDASLSFEKTKEILGCDTGACAVEIAGALGVESVITASVGRLGNKYLLTLAWLRHPRADVVARHQQALGHDIETFDTAVAEAIAQLLRNAREGS